MKILIVSDTHAQVRPLVSLIDRYVNDVQMVIHLGDHARDLLDIETNYPSLTMVAVAGNTDYYGERERVLSLEGRRVLLLHGDRRDVNSGMDRLFYYAKDKGVDVCLFGHTHIQAQFIKESIFFMNPGSVSLPRGGSNAGYGMIEITPEGEITGELLPL